MKMNRKRIQHISNKRDRRKMYELRMDENLSWREIGKKLNFSHETVHQNVKKVICRKEDERTRESQINKAKTKNQVLLLPVSVLDPDNRMSSGLRRAEIKTIGDLICCDDYIFLALRNIGIKSVSRLKINLHNLGKEKRIELKLKENDIAKVFKPWRIYQFGKKELCRLSNIGKAHHGVRAMLIKTLKDNKRK